MQAVWDAVKPWLSKLLLTHISVNWAMWPSYNSWHLCQWVRTSINRAWSAYASNLNFMYILMYCILFSNIYFLSFLLKNQKVVFLGPSITKAAMVLFSVSNVAFTVLTQRVQVYKNTVLYIVGNFHRWLQEINHKSQNVLIFCAFVLQFCILILNFLVKALNVVLLALYAVFGDSEKKYLLSALWSSE